MIFLLTDFTFQTDGPALQARHMPPRIYASARPRSDRRWTQSGPSGKAGVTAIWPIVIGRVQPNGPRPSNHFTSLYNIRKLTKLTCRRVERPRFISVYTAEQQQAANEYDRREDVQPLDIFGETTFPSLSIWPRLAMTRNKLAALPRDNS